MKDTDNFHRHSGAFGVRQHDAAFKAVTRHRSPKRLAVASLYNAQMKSVMLLTAAKGERNIPT